MIDELKNKSISTKMEHLKYFMGMKNRHSATVITKVKDDLYKIVRMPYMKLSNTAYYTIGVIVYLFNLVVVIVLRYCYRGNS